MSEREHTPQSGEVAISVPVSALELAEIDAWAADQTDRPSRPEAVRRLIRQALAMRGTPAEHDGLRPEELNAENDG